MNIAVKDQLVFAGVLYTKLSIQGCILTFENGVLTSIISRCKNSSISLSDHARLNSADLEHYKYIESVFAEYCKSRLPRKIRYFDVPEDKVICSVEALKSLIMH